MLADVDARQLSSLSLPLADAAFDIAYFSFFAEVDLLLLLFILFDGFFRLLPVRVPPSRCRRLCRFCP